MARSQPPYSYVAYIDESGDPGINKVKPLTPNGSSEWLIISAALIQATEEDNVAGWVADMMKAINSHQLVDLHFRRLDAARKTLVCSHLAQRPVRLFAIISNKQNMEGHTNPDAAQIPSDNWFYCWMTRVLLERVSDYVLADSMKRYGEPRNVKLEYSERGGLSYTQMSAYYDWIRIKSAGGTRRLFLPWGHVSFQVIHRDLMDVYTHTTRPGLKLADIVASAFFKAVDVYDTKACDPSFAELLEPRMARSPDSQMISGYGAKLMPSWRVLDQFNVPAKQREILKFYGYPKQWWQKVVDPGPV